MKMACPNCGGSIIYILGSDHVTCEYCNEDIPISKINIDEFQKFAEEMKAKKEQLDKKGLEYVSRIVKENETANLTDANQAIYKCKICKSEFIHSKLIKEKNCPYCFKYGKGFVSELKNYTVSKIIPFSISKYNLCNIISNTINTTAFSTKNLMPMFVPFKASFNDVEVNGTAIISGHKKTFNVKEKMITLEYIGKSLDKKLAESALDFNFSKLKAANKNYLDRNTVLDNIASDNKPSSSQEKILENVFHDIYVKENLKSLKKKQYASNIKCIKEEIWLLPLYIYKDIIWKKPYTILINGCNGRIIGKALNRQRNLFNLNKFKRLDNKGHKFYGISWDKDIKIS